MTNTNLENGRRPREVSDGVWCWIITKLNGLFADFNLEELYTGKDEDDDENVENIEQ